jgi:processive 1,2-diacylglycerol beta-glucosyltransferase
MTQKSANHSDGVRCLALSVDMGAGHRRAAEALCDALVRFRPGSHYQIVNALHYLGPTSEKLAKDFYFGMLQDMPQLWGLIYKQRALIDIFRSFSEFVDEMRSDKLEPVIQSFQPDVILAMHPFACGLAGALNRKAKENRLITAVITDFDGHPLWIVNGIDLYLVPMHKVACDLERHGLPTGTIVVTGLPIRAGFENIRDVTPDHQAIGLHRGLFTILLLGGGLGMGPMLETIEALSILSGPIQLVLIAGNNRDLVQSAQELAQRIAMPLIVRGFVDNIWDYLRAADVVISKPGGLTCAEVLAVGAPFVALSPIPGQEQANCETLTKAGAALYAASPREAYEAVQRLLHTPQLRHDLSQAALQLGCPNAARRAAQEILAHLANKHNKERLG